MLTARPINPPVPSPVARTLPLLVALAGCVAGPQSALDPQGPAAARFLEMHWIMTGAAALVYARALWAADFLRESELDEDPDGVHRDLGREIATPQEARKMLGMKSKTGAKRGK